jgi:DNA helicase-2/ATP-dependent DNA helicase PcrA
MAAPAALLTTLNPDQCAAVTHGDGPLQVIAGAGTGKTRVLVARIAWQITTGRARPDEICALAFMNDAADQIATRLGAMLGERAARAVWAGTSHRLAARLLRGHAGRFGRETSFSIWDEHDVDTALRDVPPAGDTCASRARVRAHTRARARARAREKDRRAAAPAAPGRRGGGR